MNAAIGQARGSGKKYVLLLVLAVLVVGYAAVRLPTSPALPALHDALPIRKGHYRSWKRVVQAEHARSIIEDPNSDCHFRACQSSLGARIRICKTFEDGAELFAMQWVNCVDCVWEEGTAFLQRTAKKMNRYLTNNGCNGL